MSKQKLWSVFTWYYRTCFRLIDRGLQKEEERWDELTERERSSFVERRRYSRNKARWPVFVIASFFCGVPLLLGQITLGLTGFPRAEWMLAWIIVFWIYFVLVAWRDTPK